MEKERKILLDIAVESWRFSSIFDQAINKLEDGEKKRYTGRLQWYRKQLVSGIQECGFKFVDVSGEIFNQGMAVTPINVDEFGENEQLIVDYMIEPIIMDIDGTVIRTGTVMLRRQSS